MMLRDWTMWSRRDKVSVGSSPALANAAFGLVAT